MTTLETAALTTDEAAGLLNKIMPIVNDHLHAAWKKDDQAVFAGAVVSTIMATQGIAAAMVMRYVEQGAVVGVMDAATEYARNIAVPGPVGTGRVIMACRSVQIPTSKEDQS